jgi:hypothetical protein
MYWPLVNGPCTACSGATPLSITIFIITTLGITIKTRHSAYGDQYDSTRYCYTEWRLCRVLFMLITPNKPTLLNVIFLSVIMLNVIMLSVIMLSVIIRSVIMLRVANKPNVLSSLCWLSFCWEPLCWVSLCWVSLCWMSLYWVSWRPCNYMTIKVL